MPFYEFLEENQPISYYSKMPPIYRKSLKKNVRTVFEILNNHQKSRPLIWGIGVYKINFFDNDLKT